MGRAVKQGHVVKSHAADALQYAHDVINGKIPACKWTIAACQRHLNDLKRAKTKEFQYRFDEAKAEKVCLFAENMPHIKGKWDSSLLKLEPWQKFILCSIFGWVRKTDGMRRFRESYAEVCRKNGKSVLAAIVGLYMLVADGEPGAEVYSGATNEKQAWEVFKPARLMAKRADGFAEFYGLEVNASNLAIIDSAAKFEPIVGEPGDGASPHCAIVDEFHEHKTSKLYDAMITGMGARTQPLMFVITTAGSNLAGPCYDKRDQICKILDGVVENDEIFAIIYTIPDDADWSNFDIWRMANPNLGVSVYEDYLRARHKEAIQRASRQNIIRCKHLNQWMNADTAWMDMLKWRKCGDPNLKPEQFKGKPCYIGIDLASKLDFAELVRLFKYENDKGEEHYAAFACHYLPEERIEEEDRANYAGWEKEGWITSTIGNAIDFEYIKDDLREIKTEFQIKEIRYDPFQATQMSMELLADGFPMVECGATVKNFSEAMKELEALIYTGRFHHNGDPVLTWMMSNVVAHIDKKDNIFPNKERFDNKIDGVVALIMCIGSAISDNTKPSIYKTRGLLVL